MSCGRLDPDIDRMNPPDNTGPGFAEFVILVALIISLVALLLGCVLLYLEINAYGGFGAVKGPSAALTVPLDAVRTLLA